ncbi:MAG: PilN domain-containing protein [Desulfobacterales bacterium]|jgi:type IV pilus assembly protein PilN
MIRINLLPFRTERKKENVRRQVSLFLLSLVLVLVVLVYYNFSLSSKIGKLNNKISATKTDLQRYNEINKEIARIKNNLETLRKKMAVIEKLESDRHAPVRLMDTLTQVLVAKRMWFTKLEVKETTVNIKGIALDNKTVADFMVRLQNSGLFSNVNLNTLKREAVQKTNLKSFEITCTKVSTPIQKAESTPKRVKT